MSRFLFARSPYPAYVYVSYHKCATQFTERVLRAVCKQYGLRAKTYDSRHTRIPALSLRMTDFLLLTDYTSSMLRLESIGARGLYVIRDPRDILVSMYFSHRFSHALNHPEIERNRLALADLGIEAGLMYLMRDSGFFRRIMRELEHWGSRNLGFHETTFEKLTAAPHEEFTRILAFLELPVEPEYLADVLDRNSFSALKREWAARHPDEEYNHYRRGKAGDWRTHLVGRVGDEFRARFGDLLPLLGYEEGSDW